MAITYLSMLDRQQSVFGGSGFHRAYTPYGILFNRRAPSLAYCGQLRDPSTGHYHLGNGHRTFNPRLMRFHSPDRLSPFGEGGPNAYAYCRGDPVNLSDPDGRMFRPPRQSFDITTIAPGLSGGSPNSTIDNAAIAAGVLVLQDGVLLKYMVGTEYYVRQARPFFAAEDHHRLPRTASTLEYATAFGSALTSAGTGVSGLVNRSRHQPSQMHTEINAWLTAVSTYSSGKVTGMLSEWKELYDTARNIAQAVTANGTTVAQIRDGTAARTLEQLYAQDSGRVGERARAMRRGTASSETEV
jgi:RHS repeat-associated protein